jgi:hypothetical protein
VLYFWNISAAKISRPLLDRLLRDDFQGQITIGIDYWIGGELPGIYVEALALRRRKVLKLKNLQYLTCGSSVSISTGFNTDSNLQPS